MSQKNKLGLTALHIAAGSGNSQALEVYVATINVLYFSIANSLNLSSIPTSYDILVQAFIREDSDCITSKTIMKETPLFFAVKNDHMVCAELLLRWGANSEVLNLRLETTNISHILSIMCLSLTSIANIFFYAYLSVPTAVITSRERPIDLAKSQDMRFLLKAANICHSKLKLTNLK